MNILSPSAFAIITSLIKLFTFLTQIIFQTLTCLAWRCWTSSISILWGWTVPHWRKHLTSAPGRGLGQPPQLLLSDALVSLFNIRLGNPQTYVSPQRTLRDLRLWRHKSSGRHLHLRCPERFQKSSHHIPLNSHALPFKQSVYSKNSFCNPVHSIQDIPYSGGPSLRTSAMLLQQSRKSYVVSKRLSIIRTNLFMTTLGYFVPPARLGIISENGPWKWTLTAHNQTGTIQSRLHSNQPPLTKRSLEEPKLGYVAYDAKRSGCPYRTTDKQSFARYGWEQYQYCKRLSCRSSPSDWQFCDIQSA